MALLPRDVSDADGSQVGGEPLVVLNSGYLGYIRGYLGVWVIIRMGLIAVRVTVKVLQCRPSAVSSGVTCTASVG